MYSVDEPVLLGRCVYANNDGKKEKEKDLKLHHCEPGTKRKVQFIRVKQLWSGKYLFLWVLYSFDLVCLQNK